jgi:hypothetical protein
VPFTANWIPTYKSTNVVQLLVASALQQELKVVNWGSKHPEAHGITRFLHLICNTLT